MQKMMKFLQALEWTEEKRQRGKIKHRLSEVVMIVLFGLLANAEYWEEIEEIAEHYESALRLYLPLKNGIPSHDTLQRVMGLINPSITGELCQIWNQLVSQEETDKLRKLLAIDGKTIRGNGSSKQKAAHIVTAYLVDQEVSLGQVKVLEKSNEITAVPQLLRMMNIEGYTISADAMSTQVEIVSQIRRQKANYVLAVKENQKTLYDDIRDYFETPELRQELENKTHSKVTVEKAHSQIESRKYYQTTDVSWLALNHPKRWKDLTSIGRVETTCEGLDGRQTVEARYYISSLPLDIDYLSSCIRRHWRIESMHWELDVVFGEDANQTQNQTATENLNNLRKLGLSILKHLEMGKRYSGRRKRFKLMLELPDYLEKLFSL